MTFSERVKKITTTENKLLCIGLDPDLTKLPEIVKSDPNPLLSFCSEIIESTKAFAAAFKLNFAFFEAEGSRGWQALEKLVELIPLDILKIADAKRGDIGTSSEMYAKGILQTLNFDAVTVNPYMGRDSVAPFLQWPEKGAFVLGVTSNPGAKDFQHLLVDSQPMFQRVIQEVKNWNRQQNCGLVVGATRPREMQTVREMVPYFPFLIPGVGAQGGDLRSAVINGTDADGGMALINASRGIIYKSNGKDFAEAAGKEAEILHRQIDLFRKEKLTNDRKRNFKNF